MDYLLCHQNIWHIDRLLRNRGIVFPEAESSYVRRMLIIYEGPFDYSSFLEMANVSMGKLGASKTWNHLLSYGLLQVAETKGKGK